jgi:cysteine desulfurase
MKFSYVPSDERGSRVYFDHNATTPVSELVAQKIPQWLSQWGNPSSIHQSGRGPKSLLRNARENVARMIGASSLEIIFTSGGTEANNLALKGVFEFFEKRAQLPDLDPATCRRRYLISAVEHPSVRRAAEYLQQVRGAEIVEIPVLRTGEIDLARYAELVDETTALVSVMLANNETGHVFPIRQMVEIAHAKGALFHADCVQALGKMPIDVRQLGVDLASFSGHKFYALKGCGFLYTRKGLTLESILHGGGQERHRRGGTENVLAIAALGAMCELRDQVEARAQGVRELRDYLEKRILTEISQVVVTGSAAERLPNTSSLVIAGVDGEILLMNLDMRGFSVSTGAACSSGSPEPSPVLLAMGLSRAEAQSSLRIGLGWGNSREEVDLFVDELKEVVRHIRSFSHPETAEVKQKELNNNSVSNGWTERNRNVEL